MIAHVRGASLGFIVLGISAFFFPAFGLVWGVCLIGGGLLGLLLSFIPWEGGEPTVVIRRPRAGDWVYPTELNRNRSTPSDNHNYWGMPESTSASNELAHTSRGSSMFDGFGAGLQEHGWLIAGFFFAFLSVICIIVAWYSDEKATSVILSGAFGIVSFFSFMASAGELSGFMSTWAKEYKAATLLVISLIAAFGFGWAAWEEGYTSIHDLGWLHVGFVIALAVAFLTVLYLAETLGDFLKGSGKVIVNAFGFGYHPFLSLVLWGLLFMVGGTFAVMASNHEVFDSWDGLPEVLKNSLIWVVAIGFFLIVFSPLVFKKR